MKERILEIMEQEALTSSRFAETIGIQRSAMSHIISGRNNPSLDVLMKILEKFPSIDSDWLIFGKGTMRRKESAVYQQHDLFNSTPEFQTNVQVVSENRREIGVKPPENAINPSIIERVIPIPAVSKNVTKIMIFYSDNTFDTFIPEKNKKE